jgi:hypothetical protein
MTDGFAHVSRLAGPENVWLCQYSGRLVQLSREAFWPLLGGKRGLILALRLHGMRNGHEEKAISFFPWRSPIIYASFRQPPQGKASGSIFSCCTPFAAAATRPPRFTDPPAAVEIGWWCSCRSMNRTTHKVTAKTSSPPLVVSCNMSKSPLA